MFTAFDNLSDVAQLQGKAQTLHAIIHLPDELLELKSIEQQQQEALEKLREDRYEEV